MEDEWDDKEWSDVDMGFIIFISKPTNASPERLHTGSEQLFHLASSAATSLLDGKGVSTSKSPKSLVGRHVGNLLFHWQDPYYSATAFVPNGMQILGNVQEALFRCRSVLPVGEGYEVSSAEVLQAFQGCRSSCRRFVSVA